MSSELLLNFDKSQSKTLSNSTNTHQSNVKKEGGSLFDSIMNEVQNESRKSPQDENQTKAEKKASQIDQDENQTKIEKKASQINQNENQTKTSIKISQINQNENQTKVEKKASQIAQEKASLLHNTQNNFVDSKTGELSENLKKVVDKLVDIIVSSAKELTENKPTQGSLQSEVVKDKINQLLGNKNIDSSTVDELKNEVNNIINNKNVEDLKVGTIKDVVSKVLEENKLLSSVLDVDDVLDKVNVIKQSAQNISSSNKNITTIVKDDSSDVVIENKELKLNTSKDTKNLTLSDKIELPKNEIKSEIVTMKNDLKNLTEGVTNSSDEDVVRIKDKITGNLEDINSSIKEISSSVSKIEVLENDDVKVVQKEVQVISSKIESDVKILKENITVVEEKISEVIIVKTTGDILTNTTNITKLNNPIDSSINKDSKNPLLATMFLQAQNSVKETTSLGQIKDAKETILNQLTLESVKQSAKKLDLNLEKTDVETQGDTTKNITPSEAKKDITINSNRFLNQALFNEKLAQNSANSVNSTKNLELNLASTEIIKQDEVDKKQEKVNSVEIVVPKDVIQNLQTKIIGAQQKMGGFMSEVARNMYLNYKPPVTAFRVNLNPANLGSISIIMKANKVDNSLNVSMNLSNSNTMESFVENKSLLQNAIQKQFNESSNVSLNFGMQDQSSENGFNQFNQNNQQNNQQNGKDNSK